MAETARRERKLVTVVFCGLVGFTSRAEALDPEDVEAILRPYHERLRAELERHGGTVEKFIGDAVMAVFGAPQVHGPRLPRCEARGRGGNGCRRRRQHGCAPSGRGPP
jgi:class 3 adenylate cyclase